MMKTVQTYLREADREGLLESIVYDELYNMDLLLEYQDKTVSEIRDAIKKRMNGLIEYLLSLEVVPSDHDVLYMVEATSYDKEYNHEHRTLTRVNLNEIRKDIYANSYAFEFSDWAETLGYLVADNKLTQNYMTELLTQYLRETSFFGFDPEARQERVKEVYDDLEQSMKEIKEGLIASAGKSLEMHEKELGLPIDEKDQRQDDLWSKSNAAEKRYNRYCNWRERSCILESLGEKPPLFVDDIKEERDNKRFEEAVFRILQMKDPKTFRWLLTKEQSFELIYDISVYGIAPLSDERVGKCILWKYSRGENGELIDNYKDLDDKAKIDAFYSYFGRNVLEELSKYGCADEKLLNMLRKGS